MDKMNEIDEIQQRLQKLMENHRLQEIKNKFAGKKILICGKGRDGECGTKCADSLSKDKCGYHQRLEIRNFLKEKADMIGYVLDGVIDKNEPIIEREKMIITEEDIDVILIFLDASGSHIELLDFAVNNECKAQIILCIKDEFSPYGQRDGVLTSKVKECIMKKQCIQITFTENRNICELSYNILCDYFRYN